MIKILIISTWEKETKRITSGISTYTRKLVDNILQEVARLRLPLEIVVVADHEEEIELHNRKLRIVRGLSLESPVKTWHRLFRTLLREQAHIIHLQFAYHLYNKVRNLLTTLITLAIVKKLRKIKIVVTMHEVLSTKYFQNTQKLVKLKGKYVEKILKLLPLHISHRLVIWLLASISDIVIVHEQFQVNILVSEYLIPREKIVKISHGVEYREELWREILQRNICSRNVHTLLVFGFLAPYKGLEVLPIILQDVKDSVRLVLAGSVHPRRVGDPLYRKWLRTVLHSLLTQLNTTWLRYVQESDIEKVFKNADLVLALHETCFGASGPENLALSYARPVVSACVDSDEKVRRIKNIVTRLVKCRALYHAWLLKLHKIAKTRSWTVVARKHVLLYLSLVLGRKVGEQ